MCIIKAAMPLLTPSQPLSHAELSSIVRLAPLVSIDLIIRNAQEEVLLGLRSNEPAKGFYFVPGGMIRKGERLREAFSRILKDETGLTADFAEARLVGVYEHFYDNNRFAEAGYGTHYVTLGYAVRFDDVSALVRDNQHSELGWWDEGAVLASDTDHAFR
jgi:GDP-mannose mannosyl hydrolase